MGESGGRGSWVVEVGTDLGMSASPAGHGNPRERKIFVGGRIVHLRRLRKVAPFNLQNNVDKGSRQNRAVTSGKGMALRVGCIGPWPEASGLGWDCSGATLDGPGWDLGVEGLGCLRVSGARLTTDLELVRTRGI